MADVKRMLLDTSSAEGAALHDALRTSAPGIEARGYA
jgi:L-lactate dehydrogenase complex protein LldG